MTENLHPDGGQSLRPTLTSALHELADSGSPGPIDVDRARRAGLRDARRARLAAVGGSVAAVAAVVVAATAVAGAGTATPSSSATSPGVPSAFTPAPLDPNDPIVTHWQFGYLPDGMESMGGAGTKGSSYSTTWAYTVGKDGFRIQIDTLNQEPSLHPSYVQVPRGGVPQGKQPTAQPIVQATVKGGPTQWIPAHVDGAKKAFWAGYDGKIVNPGGDVVQNLATLYWETADGHWLDVTAVNVDDRPDWEAQMLKAASHVVHADRSVPMPIKIGPFPADFQNDGAAISRYDGAVSVSMLRRVGQTTIIVLAFQAGQKQFMPNGVLDGAPPQARHTCKDSNGLTLCVAVDGAEPASLTAIDGRQGLLDRITSLGTDEANWTTDVLK